MKWFAAFNLVVVLCLLLAGHGGAGLKQLLLEEQVAEAFCETAPEKSPQTESLSLVQERAQQRSLQLLVPALLLSVPVPLTHSSYLAHFSLSRQQNGPPIRS